MIRFGLCVAATMMAIGGCPNNDCVKTPATEPVELGVEIPIPDEGATHVPFGTTVCYEANPPASGNHWPSPADPGFYETPLQEEYWVHNLEHGYVVVLFDCRGDCDETLLDSLRQFADNAPASEKYGYAKIVITPYDGLPQPALLTAVAWGVQLHLGEFDEAALLAFVGRYQDQGPEDAP